MSKRLLLAVVGASVVGSVLLALRVPGAADAQPLKKFKHVVVVFQENRTPDNLFQGLCQPPFGTAASCSESPTAKQYNIKTTNWLNRAKTVQPTSVPLANDYDLGHSHKNFVAMCDPVGRACRMDGADSVSCGPKPACKAAGTLPQFKFVDNSTKILDPYLRLATEYGWANLMFQTNQGPSYPAHQFIFGGTSGRDSLDDTKAIFASSNMLKTGIGGTHAQSGCTEPKVWVELIKPPGIENDSTHPCFERHTLADVLPAAVNWRYYTPLPGSIWTAPNSIRHICLENAGKCTGPEYTQNVDDQDPADVLRDIANCKLRSISWVIPTGHNSDHAHDNDGGGPSWVASIVNSIGENTNCDGNTGYWKDTAIIITWDDWGGWYDHVAPTILPGIQGDYQYGFRVPLVVVSAYTPKAFIDNSRHDFGSILRFIQWNFGIAEGKLGFADHRATTNLTDFFKMALAPRPFQHVAAQKPTTFFLNDKRKATAPDIDDDPGAPQPSPARGAARGGRGQKKAPGKGRGVP